MFFQSTQTLSEIQFTRHFQFVGPKTKQFVGSNINVKLDAANLRPALEHVCGKQTSSAKKLFFWANLIMIAFITFNNSLAPWLRVYEVQIHANLSLRFSRLNPILVKSVNIAPQPLKYTFFSILRLSRLNPIFWNASKSPRKRKRKEKRKGKIYIPVLKQVRICIPRGRHVKEACAVYYTLHIKGSCMHFIHK